MGKIFQAVEGKAQEEAWRSVIPFLLFSLVSVVCRVSEATGKMCLSWRFRRNHP